MQILINVDFLLCIFKFISLSLFFPKLVEVSCDLYILNIATFSYHCISNSCPHSTLIVHLMCVLCYVVSVCINLVVENVCENFWFVSTWLNFWVLCMQNCWCSAWTLSTSLHTWMPVCVRSLMGFAVLHLCNSVWACSQVFRTFRYL